MSYVAMLACLIGGCVDVEAAASRWFLYVRAAAPDYCVVVTQCGGVTTECELRLRATRVARLSARSMRPSEGRSSVCRGSGLGRGVAGLRVVALSSLGCGQLGRAALQLERER